MNQALVSIITPAFNCASTIKGTFDSVLSQTYENWEWIIVDDCSSDGSFQFIQDLVKDDNRIRVLQLAENSGPASARNAGLRHANGRYITFLDSDDALDPNYLECQLEFIKDNGPLVSAGYRRKAEHTCTEFHVPDVADYKTILKGNPLSCLTTMYDRSVIGDVFFPESFDKAEDYSFWLDILKTGVIARGNPRVLATYNIVKGSRSSNKLCLVKRMYRVYRETQGIGRIKSWYYVFCWAIYGVKKYRNVR